MKRLSRRLSLLCHLQLCFLSVSPHSTQQMRARHWLLLSQLLAREARVGRPTPLLALLCIGHALLAITMVVPWFLLLLGSPNFLACWRAAAPAPTTPPSLAAGRGGRGRAAHAGLCTRHRGAGLCPPTGARGAGRGWLQQPAHAAAGARPPGPAGPAARAAVQPAVHSACTAGAAERGGATGGGALSLLAALQGWQRPRSARAALPPTLHSRCVVCGAGAAWVGGRPP